MREARIIKFPPMEEWQRPVFDHFTKNGTKDRRACLKSRRQIGKTTLCELIVIYYAVTRKSVSVIIEPTLGQARRVFKQIADMLRGAGAVRSANGTLLELELTNGSEIYFKSGEQKDSLRGITVTGILIIDEAAFVPDDVIDILMPTVDANRASLLVVSTPLFTEGRFYEFTKDPSFEYFDWCKYDTSKYLSDERLEHYRQTVSELRFRTEYLGEFISEGGFVFKSYRVSDSKSAPLCCGIDFGVGAGGDYTWLTFLDSYGHSTGVWYDNRLSPTQAVETMIGLINKSGVKTVAVEMNSIGSVYYDMMRKRLPKDCVIAKFTTTNETKRTAIESLARAMEEERCLPYNDRELKRQLANFTVMKTKTGYTYNGAAGCHDDGVMSLAIAYHALENGNARYCVSAPKRRSRKIKERR